MDRKLDRTRSLPTHFLSRRSSQPRNRILARVSEASTKLRDRQLCRIWDKTVYQERILCEGRTLDWRCTCHLVGECRLRRTSLFVRSTMRKQIVISAILFALSSSMVIAEEQTLKLNIQKMYCVLCPITVTKAMERVQGVRKVAVDYKSKTASVVFENKITSWETIAEASTLAGYPASKLD